MNARNTSFPEAAGRFQGRGHAAARCAEWLGLAAAPTFALMALLTALFGGGPPDVFCSGMQASHLSGMVAMYILMSVFHSTPWLRLILSR